MIIMGVLIEQVYHEENITKRKEVQIILAIVTIYTQGMNGKEVLAKLIENIFSSAKQIMNLLKS